MSQEGLLVEPELFKALKKRIEFDGEAAIEHLTNKITRLKNNLKILSKKITNTLVLLTDNPKGPSSKLFTKQLDDLTLEKSEKQDEIEFCESELKRVKDQKPIGANSYKKILE